MLARAEALLNLGQELGVFTFKDIRGYRLNIRASVRALWLGLITVDDFILEMLGAIRRGFRQAWAEGMGEHGFTLEDMSRNERIALEKQINQELDFVPRFGDYIYANRKEVGGKLTTVMKRADNWVKAYTRVKGMAATMAANDQALEWVLHPAEHCNSCLRLSGKVKRGSFWSERGIFPKAWDKLDCKFGCKCTLEPTKKPLSKGRLPNLP